MIQNSAIYTNQSNSHKASARYPVIRQKSGAHASRAIAVLNSEEATEIPSGELRGTPSDFRQMCQGKGDPKLVNAFVKYIVKTKGWAKEEYAQQLVKDMFDPKTHFEERGWVAVDSKNQIPLAAAWSYFMEHFTGMLAVKNTRQGSKSVSTQVEKPTTTIGDPSKLAAARSATQWDSVAPTVPQQTNRHRGMAKQLTVIGGETKRGDKDSMPTSPRERVKIKLTRKKTEIDPIAVAQTPRMSTSSHLSNIDAKVTSKQAGEIDDAFNDALKLITVAIENPAFNRAPLHAAVFTFLDLIAPLPVSLELRSAVVRLSNSLIRKKDLTAKDLTDLHNALVNLFEDTKVTTTPPIHNVSNDANDAKIIADPNTAKRTPRPAASHSDIHTKNMTIERAREISNAFSNALNLIELASRDQAVGTALPEALLTVLKLILPMADELPPELRLDVYDWYTRLNSEVLTKDDLEALHKALDELFKNAKARMKRLGST